MELFELILKVLGVLVSLLGLVAAIYNIATSRSHAKQLAKERHDTERLEANVVLAARTEQRVTALESRLGSFEQRIEHRIDQIAGDLSQLKDLFTNYLINKH